MSRSAIMKAGLPKGIEIMKKSIKVLCAAALACMLSGCFKSRIVIDVTKDGTASGNVTLMMSVSMLTMDGTSIEDAMAEMEAQYREEYPDAKIEPYREGEGESEYAGVRINVIPVEGLDIKKEGGKITVTVPLSGVQDEIADESGAAEQGTNISMLKNYGAEATIRINMPYKPTANYGTVTDNTVVVDLLSDSVKEPLIITCSAGPSPALIAAIIAVVAVAIGLLAFFLSKKKQNI